MTSVPETPLVGPDWLAAHLDQPELRVFDTTVHLRPATPGPYRIESGLHDYRTAHVPGAAFLDLPGALSDPHARLPFTMPEPDRLAAALGAAGLGDEHVVVLYSATWAMWATRVWWMLHSVGFERALVLDGGLRRWRLEGRPLSSETVSYPPATFTARPRPERWADKDEVLRSIGSETVCTVNALAAAVHRGESDTNYGRRGHIAGSVNVPYESLVQADGSYRSSDDLRAAFDAVGAFGHQRVICYCGGGISATMDAFALTLLGHPNVAVYDGSMAEWVRDPDLPMEQGA